MLTFTSTGLPRLSRPTELSTSVVVPLTWTRALSTGTNLTVTWTYSPKITVSGVIQNEKRDFRPLSGVVITSGLTDRTHNANVGVAYEPWRGVTMGRSAFANGRSGSRAAFTNSYHDKGASFNVGLKF